MNRQGDERSGANMAAFMRRRLGSGLLALAVVAASLTTAALPAQADAPGTYSRPVTGAKIVIDDEPEIWIFEGFAVIVRVEPSGATGMGRSQPGAKGTSRQASNAQIRLISLSVYEWRRPSV